ncbi:hypothetical protein KY328_00655 [Candidatus Woesearchaeota archaeon]|nr:hypothetical protein [Candidatus Woesearchaeota archaeon]MBW3021407.1 hypothetical protein [Candidatus Woesearchaeota archaeon]
MIDLIIADIVLIIVSKIGATLTHDVSVRAKKGPVLASALLSLVVGLVFYFFPHLTTPELATAIPVAFIGASFAGMASPKTIPTKYMPFAGLVFGLIFVNTSKFFTGYGGGLGTTACLSCVITLGLMYMVKKK